MSTEIEWYKSRIKRLEAAHKELIAALDESLNWLDVFYNDAGPRKARAVFARFTDLWQDGKIAFKGTAFYWKAKVYKEGSKYGIDGGPISNLMISMDQFSEDIWIYDRSWSTLKPPEELLKAILAEVVSA